MKRVLCTILPVLVCCTLAGQKPGDAEAITKQCSAIRELVYLGWTKQFDPIRMEQLRSSNGHQTMGTWQFETTRFNTSMLWQGANLSYLEHYEESTDSTRTDQWQYIAEYSHVPDVLQAESLYRQLNNEIEGCVYVLNDSTNLAFIELSPDRLPAERPSSLQIASLYELPLTDSTIQPAALITVMVGLEKRLKDYRVSLIIENLLRDDKASRLAKGKQTVAPITNE